MKHIQVNQKDYTYTHTTGDNVILECGNKRWLVFLNEYLHESNLSIEEKITRYINEELYTPLSDLG